MGIFCVRRVYCVLNTLTDAEPPIAAECGEREKRRKTVQLLLLLLWLLALLLLLSLLHVALQSPVYGDYIHEPSANSRHTDINRVRDYAWTERGGRVGANRQFVWHKKEAGGGCPALITTLFVSSTSLCCDAHDAAYA